MNSSNDVREFPVRSYVVRIYRIVAGVQGGPVGIVHGEDIEGDAAFTSMEELWQILLRNTENASGDCRARPSNEG